MARGARQARRTWRRSPASRAGLDRCIVLGRGFEYATAREWALKLKELAQVAADPYSAADFQHGPLALVEPGYPILAVAPDGRHAARACASCCRGCATSTGSTWWSSPTIPRPRRSAAAALPIPDGARRVAEPPRVDPAGAALRVPPDPRPRPGHRAAPLDQQGHPDPLAHSWTISPGLAVPSGSCQARACGGVWVRAGLASLWRCRISPCTADGAVGIVAAGRQASWTVEA